MGLSRTGPWETDIAVIPYKSSRGTGDSRKGQVGEGTLHERVLLEKGGQTDPSFYSFTAPGQTSQHGTGRQQTCQGR